MAIKIKICGITNRDDALAACDAGVDALGFVFAEEAKARKRYIEADDALAIIEELPPFVTTVAVTVNAPLERLVHYLAFMDLVQLHGEEKPGYLPMGHLAIKAFRTGPGFSLSDMKAHHNVRAWLLDAWTADSRGGTGKVCDWELAKGAVAAGKPVILAGGLTPENVAEAVRIVQPFALDTSGGVEKAPGKKDHERIRQFIRNAKEASLSG
jgi:phosphoribosylanthranilate isomerase